MDAVERIRAFGFRKWYERQLVLGHLYLVACILGLILVAAAVEVYLSQTGRTGLAFALAMGIPGVALAAVGWERYRRIMLVADHLVSNATCQRCQVYGSFDIKEAGAAMHQEPVDIQNADEVWVKVHCKKCGNEWQI